MYDSMSEDYDPYPESQAISDNEANDYRNEGEDYEDECCVCYEDEDGIIHECDEHA